MWQTLIRRARLVGHILRHAGLVISVNEGSVDGKNCMGRQRLEYIKPLIIDARCGKYLEIKRLAQERRTASVQSNDCWQKRNFLTFSKFDP